MQMAPFTPSTMLSALSVTQEMKSAIFTKAKTIVGKEIRALANTDFYWLLLPKQTLKTFQVIFKTLLKKSTIVFQVRFTISTMVMEKSSSKQSQPFRQRL